MSTVSSTLAHWYACNKRDLPWRHTRDAYLIWLSEVILQQTRVDQGLAYWRRFSERFPTVHQLAQASEDEVLRLWQGLGYYSRARNLRQAAQQVVEQHDGVFPAQPEILRSLKGVGDYTAAAIASIAYGMPEAVVDGNVYRVLARLYGSATPIDTQQGRKEFKMLAQQLLDPQRPGDHNQAMMELGATVCLPRMPRCTVCPLSPHCIAYRDPRMQDLPVKMGKAKVRKRHFNYLLISHSGGIYLRKRTAKDIWQGLYELPLIETPQEMKRFRSQGLPIEAPRLLEGPVVHLLSHQRIEAKLWEGQLAQAGSAPADWVWVDPDRSDRYAVPRLIERWLAKVMLVE